MEYWKKASIVFALGMFTDSIDFLLLAYIIPLLVPLWRITSAEVGIMGTIFNIIVILMAIISGPISDYFGRTKVWSIGNLLAGIFLTASTFTDNWLYFAILRGIGSATVGVTIPQYYTLIPEEAPPRIRATLAALIQAITAAIASVLYGTFLGLAGVIPWLDWRFMVRFLALWNIIAAVSGFLVLKEPAIWRERRQLAKEGKLQETRQEMSYKALFKREFAGIFILAALLPCLLGMGSFGFVVINFISYFQTAQMKFPQAIIGMVAMVGTIWGTVVRLITGPISDRVGRLKTIIVFIIPGLIASQVLWRLPYFGTGEALGLIIAFIITYMITGLVMYGLEVPPFIYLAEIVPTLSRGTAETFVMILRGVLNGILSLVVGYWALVAPCEAYAWYSAIVSIAALICASILLRKGLDRTGKPLL